MTATDSALLSQLAPPDQGGVLSARYRALTLGIVSVVLLLAFEATAVNTAMPVAARQLHGVGLYAFAFSGYFTSTLFAMVLSGEWCDRRGPVLPLFAGIGVFAGGLVVAGTAANMWLFVSGRAIQGLGGGLVIVALYVVAGRAFPERLRPAVFAAFSAAWVLPSIIGPVVSGAVTQHLGWRWVFLAVPMLVVLPLAVMGPALRRAEREQELPPASGRGYPQPGGALNRRRIGLAAMAALGAGLLQWAGERRDPVALLPALVGLALLVPAVLRLLPAGTLRAGRGLPTLILLRGVASGAFFAAEAFIPLMMVTQRHLSPTMAGLTLTSGGLSWSFGSWLQGRPGADRHRELLIRLGFLFTSVAVAGAALVLLPAMPTWTAAVAWAFGGLGMGLLIASISVLMLKFSPPEAAGANSASLQVSDSLGTVLLVGLAGVLFAAGGGGAVTAATAGASVPRAAFGMIFVVMAAVSLGGAALAGRVRPRD
ncbi:MULTISPECIES: MFS transporter [Kitasatospora]|uniref:MFS transporter n=1 Tax=Kitasatospora TaxID=2063 RepID=UPI0024759B57|nr:MFS transporter [Kitasatospora sp. GP30]